MYYSVMKDGTIISAKTENELIQKVLEYLTSDWD